MWAIEIIRMLLTQMLAWENTEQDLLVCNAINLIYELKLLSCALTRHIVKTCQHSFGTWKATDMFRLQATFSPSLSQNSDEEGGADVKISLRSNSFLLIPSEKKRRDFSTHLKHSFLSLCVSVTCKLDTKFIITVKGLSLMLCKHCWVSDCFYDTNLNVYSFTAHSLRVILIDF